MRRDRDILILIGVLVGLSGWVMWEAVPPAQKNSVTSKADIAAMQGQELAMLRVHPQTATVAVNVKHSSGEYKTFITKEGVRMGQQVYTSGSGTWTVPTGVTSVSVTCWGGGAAGTNMSSGGGGGGCSVTPSYAVTPGASIPYAVGSGGAASTNDGADTSFDTSGVVAKGGKAAASSSLGGAAASGTGTTRYSGGNGGLRGGGGSAGPSSNGNNNSGNTGGAAVTDGGAGGDIDIAGFAPGGGAGGTNGFSAQPGANGRIQIDWVDPSSSLPCAYVPPTKSFGPNGDLHEMLKNATGQKIGAQMITAADGSDFTGSVTVYVTGDAGTQAAGSVGSGACTHEGNGYHTYAPSQAETNYDLIGFTFKAATAITNTVQVATVAAPPLDAAGVRSAVGLGSANLDTQLAAIDDAIDTEVAAIKAKTDLIPAAPAAVGDCITEAGVRTAVGLATANLDTQLTPLGTGFSRAVKAITLGTVDTGATTTIIPTSSLSPAAVDANQFRGQVVCFANDTTTTALRGQKTDITGSSSGGILTVNELTSTPVSGDTFTIQ